MSRATNKRQPFTVSHPHLLREWDFEKNVGIDPHSLTAGNHRKVWWKCSKNPAHSWQGVVGNRARQGKGCPYCASQRTIPEESLEALRPELMKDWHPSKNKYAPSTLALGSQKEVWWLCSKGHEWHTMVKTRTQHDRGCPSCGRSNLFAHNSLAVASPSVAAEWHPTKNLPLTPETVTRASGKKVWWKCSVNPEHEWQAVIRNRTVVSSGCPQCAAGRLREALFETTQANADFFRTFNKAISVLTSFLNRQLPKQINLQQPFYRMLYSSAITAMETYLSDAFFQRLINNEELINRLLITAPEFREKKYSIADLVDWRAQARDKVSDYILDMAWHNIPKVEALYRNVLDITFLKDSSPIHRAVAIRHDLVHRNGRRKNGTFHKFSKQDIETLFTSLGHFVTHIDQQIKAQYKSKGKWKGRA